MSSNSNSQSVEARVQDFVRMNPPEFLGSQIGEDPKNFIDQVKKIFGVMQVTRNDRVDFIPRELREAKAKEFMNLRQGSMSVQEYRLKFTHHCKYSPHMVADLRAQMSKFLFRVSDLVKTKCRNAMLLEDMNISRLMTHAQQVEGDKLSELDKDNKKS
ncbi:hypothetical protein MTR67_039866 [Solanum verrucosum]|uniref:Retrotransposon gag domain-containing protein n=1 Tax=Solanum verrucosum TaxID=315347 RepID=A0AAF0UJC4_SOLVR|nr:hypothetical protein MTR67_039866 [Solanum verrucosum]